MRDKISAFLVTLSACVMCALIAWQESAEYTATRVQLQTIANIKSMCDGGKLPGVKNGAKSPPIHFGNERYSCQKIK